MSRRSGRTRRIDYFALNESHTIQEHNVHPHTVYFQNFEKNYDKSKLNKCVCLIEDEEFNDLQLKNLIEETKLNKPILIRGANPNVLNTYNPKINIDFKIPNYDIVQLTDKIGPEHKVPVMDVMTQNNSPRWNMQRWCEYFQALKENRDKIRNVISLEISDTDLGNELEIPKVVSDLDIVLKLFTNNDNNDINDDNDNNNNNNHKNDRKNNTNFSELLESNGIYPPKVQKYILMSIAGSYTDFHIDFAGTSVYYSPISGHKKFILIPPLHRNLEIYKKWCLSDDQNKIWLPSLLKPFTTGEFNKLKNQGIPDAYLNNGFVLDIYPGDLLLLPSMWIHSVYTEEDSLIIGGNFLNLLSLENHLQAYKIEIETKVDEQFKFPNFIKFVWLIAYYLMDVLKPDFLQNFEIDCYTNLINFLKDQWNYISNPPSTKRDKLLISKIKLAIPKDIIGDVNNFLNDLEDWINGYHSNNSTLKRQKRV